MIDENMNDLKQNRTGSGSPGKTRLMLAGLGVGGMLAYLISRSRRASRHVRDYEMPHESDSPDNVVDDRGTQQSEAVSMLRNLRDRGFESSDEKVALALGRTPEEIQAFSSGREVIDDDLIMKARGIAMHRGIAID